MSGWVVGQARVNGWGGGKAVGEGKEDARDTDEGVDHDNALLADLEGGGQSEAITYHVTRDEPIY